ncbi:MAG: hypothetical protein JWR80_4518 [Bradyrhizobium sp.]|nr:hypothetical protein [Bradyrhizobium sp.]
MGRHLTPPALALMFSLALASAASAETVSQTARKWGLIGSWAVDCSVPRDKAHPLFSYEVTADDRVMHRRDFGTAEDEQEVGSAEIAGDNVLILRIFFPVFKQTRVSGIVKQPDGSIRAIYNRDEEKGEYSIRDGKFVATGKPTVALRKCAPHA